MDQAEGLARGFSDAVRQRLVMHDENTGVSQVVTVSGGQSGRIERVALTSA